MKKVICFVLNIILALLFVMPSVCALDYSDKNREATFLNAVTFTCTYDVKQKEVLIDGTVAHDFMLSHGNYRIKVYSCMPQENIWDIINNPESKVLAESDMTVKFTFYIDAPDILERYSEYAIIFTSPDGENHLAGQPMLPSVSSDFEYDGSDRSGFKGILSDSAVNIGASGAGTVIVDIDIGQTVGNSSDSILYPMRDTYIHIKKSYITQIDKQIRAASVNGSNVYLRLLLSANHKSLGIAYSDNENMYTLPNLYSADVLEYIFTVSEFLSERYNGDKGQVCGIIPGTEIDDTVSVNCIGNISTDEYAKLYTLYLAVVGNAARATKKDFNIIIPFSDNNSYADAQNNSQIANNSAVLLEKIVYRLDNNVSGDFDCSIMIESKVSPIVINEIEGVLDVTVNTDNSVLTPYNIQAMTLYLDKLSSRYKSVPSNVIYMWTPNEEMSGNELDCAYAYSYLKLVSNHAVSSFVVHTDGIRYDSLHSIIRVIDTDKAEDKLNSIAKYYGFASWNTLLKENPEIPILRKVFDTDFTTNKPSDILGEFQYMDFTASSVYGIMTEGENCGFIRSDYNSVGTRALCLGASAVGVGGYVESIGFFEYPESYEYTEYLSLTVEIDDKNLSDDALYEITLTLGMQKTEICAVGVMANGETKQFFFDVSEFSDASMADYIKISARSLTHSSEGYSIFLHELRGYSMEYDTSTLEQLVEEKRREIRNESTEDDSGFDYKFILTIAGVIFAMAALAVGLMIVFKRDDESDSNNDKQ